MTYINENPIYAERVEYEGSHDPSEVVCTITWCVADVLDMMAHQGIELTDENLENILNRRFERTLQERSTEEGWEIIDVLVSDAMWMKDTGR